MWIDHDHQGRIAAVFEQRQSHHADSDEVSPAELAGARAKFELDRVDRRREKLAALAPVDRLAALDLPPRALPLLLIRMSPRFRSLPVELQSAIDSALDSAAALLDSALRL